jgi:hypothetical protein
MATRQPIGRNLETTVPVDRGALAGGPWSRRDLLRIGALGISASVLPRLHAQAAGANAPPAKAKSVIYLMMMGGVTHIDSFDPKPDAPEEIRGTLGTIPTTLPGVHFTEVMPCLAGITDKLALVRSYSHTTNDHFVGQAWALSGREVTVATFRGQPNIGSVVSCLQGPRAQLPGYIAVPGITRPGPPPTMMFGGGWLGGEYDPFAVGGEPEQPDFTATDKNDNPSALVDENLRPAALEFRKDMDLDRLAHRAQLRKVLDQTLSAADQRDDFDSIQGHYKSAFNLLSSNKIRQAFDLAPESARTRESYGRTKIGGRCLMARRLVEAGARFVMVDYGYDNDYGNLWDNHNVPEQRMPHISEMAKRRYHLAGMDRAFAGLISDLDARGLLDSTLVVFMTEFGRSPKINKFGGRDHWGAAGSMFFAGGGTRGGQVIGQTDKQGAQVLTPGHSPGDIAATIYRSIGLDPQTMLHDRQGRPMLALPHGQPIPGVLA